MVERGEYTTGGVSDEWSENGKWEEEKLKAETRSTAKIR
jgi:hypothetical protein